MIADDIQSEGVLRRVMERGKCLGAASAQPQSLEMAGTRAASADATTYTRTGRLLTGSSPDSVLQDPPRAVLLISEVIIVGRTTAGVAA